MEEKVILTQQELEKVSGGAGNDGTYSYQHLYNAIIAKLRDDNSLGDLKGQISQLASECGSYYSRKSTYFHEKFEQLKQLLVDCGYTNDSNIQTLINNVVMF